VRFGTGLGQAVTNRRPNDASRDESRDQSLSVLEIRREFVSWIQDSFAAIATILPGHKAITPPGDSELRSLCFWPVECHASTVLASRRGVTNRVRRVS
jgi:hypothetical protein